MDSDFPIGADLSRGKRRWSKVVVGLLALPIGLFVLSNLALNSGWTRRWVAGKLERNFGLPTQVGGLSWSPWFGVEAQNVVIQQPEPLRAGVKEPLARIERVRVVPVWRDWLHRRWTTRSVTFVSPRLVMPLEILSHFATPPQPTLPAAGPPVAVAIPPTPPPVAGPAVAPVPGPTAVPTPVAAPLPALPPIPTTWLHLENASFALVHAGSDHALAEFSGFSGAIPVAGDPAKSHIGVDHIFVGGHEMAEHLGSDIAWKWPVLALRPVSFGAAGLDFRVAAQVASLEGAPVQLEWEMPSQELKETALPLGATASARSISAAFRFRGLLLAPVTWTGVLTAAADAPIVRVGTKEQAFDRASLVGVLQGGALECREVKIVSDSLALLGNGAILADGRISGSLRLIGPPDSVTGIVAEAFPTLPKPPSLTPLATPQRSAFDIEAVGSLGALQVRFGADGPIVNLSTQAPPP